MRIPSLARVSPQGFLIDAECGAPYGLASLRAQGTCVKQPTLAPFLCLILIMTTPACATRPEPPKAKLNPSPTEAFEVTVRIEDAPGSFSSAEGFTDFQVSEDSRNCLPYLDSVSGARMNPIESVPTTFTQVSEHEYRGIVHLDALVDEDYYGQGVCHWVMTFAGMKFRGKSPAIFSESLSRGDLTAGRQVTTRFLTKDYFSTDLGEHAAVAIRNKDSLPPGIEAFAVTISAERIEK